MWAAATLPCRLWSPAIATTTAGDKGPFTVCARNSRPQKNIRYDYEDEDEEDMNNNRELEILKQQEIGDLDLDASASASAPNSEKISGSAVLLALQKASAQKTSKKKKKKEMKNMKEDKDSRRNRDAIVDYSDVKPLCIKSDWKDRLDELEMQLHQLIHEP